MKRINFLLPALLAVIFLSVNIYAQESIPEYKNYDWKKDPKIHTISDEEAKENSLILKDMRIIEYDYEKNGDLVMYNTRHRIVRVNSDNAIESNNKVYISMYNVIELVDLKARSVSPSGKVTLLDKKNVKEIENYENAGPFKIFAIEGIEKGSEVEYLYTIKKSASYFGTEIMQSTEARKDVDLEILSPKNLTFEAKSYNDFPQAVTDTTLADKHKLTLHADKVPLLKEEKFSAYSASLMRVEYKLAYNTVKGSKRLLTWNDASDRYYQNLYTITPKAKSKIASFIKEMGISKLNTDEEKIKKIESYIKTSITVKTDYSEDASDIEKILKNKFSNEFGIVKLFLNTYNEAGLNPEIVLTSDRFKQKFDGSFDTWNFLDEYLLYFPSTGSFIAPKEPFSRYGYVPAEFTSTDGLFIRPLTIGDFTTGVGKVKNIPTTDYTSNYSKLSVDMHFAEDFTKTDMHVKQVYTGYEAARYQPVYAYLTEENKKELDNALLKIVGDDAKMTNVKVSNYDESSVMVKPFIMEADLSSPSLLEKAGNKYLFKIGATIGRQSELYQEEERKTEVENNFNHGYTRELTFTIPDGYTVSNLDALNIDVNAEEEGKRTMEFKSSYSIEGNKVKVTVDENYRKLTFPVDKFEEFRKVINAAADFNKIVLFMEKK